MKLSRLLLSIIVLMLLVSGLPVQAVAALQNLGVDSAGNRLIYDTDLNITWYDFTNSVTSWQNQVDWADALTVNFGVNMYSDWRLPAAVDGEYSYGYDGTTTVGYNITSGELGHLFYTELGNEGYYDTSGNPTGCSTSSPWCLTSTGYFQNLQANDFYWTGTELTYFTDGSYAWFFDFREGWQTYAPKGNGNYALAVRDGRAVAPEPLSSALFIIGGATLGFRKLSRRCKNIMTQR